MTPADPHPSSPDDREVVLHHGDPAAELEAGLRAAVLLDVSARGRLHLTGSRRLSYLHRITAQDVRSLAPPRGARAALLERTGKIVDVLTIHAFDGHALVLTSAANRHRASEWLGRFIFREDVQVEDRTGTTGQLRLLGPRSGDVVRELAGPAAGDMELHSWTPLRGPREARVVRSGRCSWELLAASADLPAIREGVLERGREAGLRPAGDLAGRALRVLGGIPTGGREIDERSNPLELGLEDSVDLGKGCFTGQEALAKMQTYGTVKRRLVGLELSRECEEGESLLCGDEAVGRVTSVALLPGTGRCVGLGLVRRDQAEAGVRLDCGPARAEVVPLPFPAMSRR